MASPAGNPIVGAAGLLLGLARFRKIDAVCLLGETRGYLPDPRAAKSVLEVLQRMLRVKIDLSGLDEEIEKSKEIVERMKEIEKRREKYTRKMRKVEEERITYIS
jgi:proteasome assembly chaperone (PAC2) family protein